MPKSCEGRVALVTGASQGGTGTSLALRLAAEGAAVAITARSEPGLATCREAIESVGGTALVLPCDLSDPDGGRTDLVAKAEAELGPLDILVNNAAIGPYQPFDTFTAEEFRRTSEVNVWSPWVLMQKAIPGMRERGRGWVLNLTTSVAVHPVGPPFPNTGPAKTGTLYGGTKAMLNRVTVGVAAEVEGQGIAVNALAPNAAILTPALQSAYDTGLIHRDFFEPLDTMIEAGLAFCTASPNELHARIAFSLDLLVELDRPVRDLRGKALVDDWQPADLPPRIEAQKKVRSAGAGGGYGLDS